MYYDSNPDGKDYNFRAETDYDPEFEKPRILRSNTVNPWAFYGLCLLILMFAAIASCTGCNPTPNPIPTPEPTPIPEEKITVQGWDADSTWAWNQAIELTPAIDPAPAPDTPVGPKIGDTCPSCEGKGKVGDGTIMTDCLDCQADGKVDEGDPILSGISEFDTADAVDATLIVVPDDPYATKDDIENLHDLLEGQATLIAVLTERLEALDARCQCGKETDQSSSPGKETPATPQYRIMYEGKPWLWDGEQKAFIDPITKYMIRYPSLNPATTPYANVQGQLIPIEELKP